MEDLAPLLKAIRENFPDCKRALLKKTDQDALTDGITVQGFLDEFPCLQEVDGYLWGLKEWGDGVPPETLRLVEGYRQQLLKGKIIPRESRMERKYEYIRGKPPRLRPWVRVMEAQEPGFEPDLVDEDDEI